MCMKHCILKCNTFLSYNDDNPAKNPAHSLRKLKHSVHAYSPLPVVCVIVSFQSIYLNTRNDATAQHHCLHFLQRHKADTCGMMAIHLPIKPKLFQSYTSTKMLSEAEAGCRWITFINLSFINDSWSAYAHVVLKLWDGTKVNPHTGLIHFEAYGRKETAL